MKEVKPQKVGLEIFEEIVKDGTKIVIPFTIGGKLLPIVIDAHDFLITLKAANVIGVEVLQYETLVSVRDIDFPLTKSQEDIEREKSSRLFEETYSDIETASKVAKDLANTTDGFHAVIQDYSVSKYRVVNGRWDLDRSYYHGVGGRKCYFEVVAKFEPEIK